MSIIIILFIFFPNSSPTILNKCPTSQTPPSLIIPPSLRVPYPEKILTELEEKLNILDPFNFTLEEGRSSIFLADRMDCMGSLGFSKIELELLVKNNYAEYIPQNKKKKNLRMDYSETLYYFTAFGVLKVEDYYIHPAHYCVQNVTDEVISVNVCIPNNSSVVKPIPKCCPHGMFLKKLLVLGCAPSIVEWDPMDTNNSQPIVYKYVQLGNCSKTMKVQLKDGYSKYSTLIQKQIRIKEDGSVYTRHSGNDKWEMVTGDFCLDGVLPDKNSTDLRMHKVLTQCEKEDDEVEKIYALVFFSALILSAIFSLLTVTIYGLIWKEQNVHGWTVAMFALSSFFYSVFLALGYGLGLWGSSYDDGCIAVGILSQFFSIALFSWMTTLNFDLWSTLKSMTPLSQRSKGKKRFVAYFVFSFGVPLLVVIISLILEHQYDYFDDRVIRPQYGVEECHVSKTAEFSHGIIPNTILYITNLIFILLAFKVLWNFGKAKGPSNIRSTKRSQSRVKLMGKLFVVMGISWFFEILSWLTTGAHLTWYWAIFDLYNFLQAVIIFCIFVLLGKDVKKQLMAKYPIIDELMSRLWGKDSLKEASTQMTTTSSTAVP